MLATVAEGFVIGFVIGAVVLWVLGIALVADRARKRGRDPVGWGLLAFGFTPSTRSSP
jgi:hypothetical protein